MNFTLPATSCPPLPGFSGTPDRSKSTENVAIHFVGLRRAELHANPIKPLPDDAILVRNEYTAISTGTEVFNFVHGANPGKPPVFPRATGYCSAGVVVAVGPAVRDIAVGDRVAGQGHHEQYSILRHKKAVYVKIPENVSSRSASMLVLAAIALHGIRIARIELGEPVLVFGLGIIGQIAASLARLSGGYPVIGADLMPDRLLKAKERAIDAVINPAEIGDLPALVRTLSGNDGAPVVFEATGHPDVYPTVVQLAATGGRVVALGSPRGSVTFNFLNDVHVREVSILGAYHPLTPIGTHRYYPWSMERERSMLMALMANGRLCLENLFTHTFSPVECNHVYNMLADPNPPAIGVIFDWTLTL
jgi:2-desacetyl-2-hydroxyethyl bacteriochlorophyllide A dehydrogenase